MPFTATHIAAAVPMAWLCRWRVPFSALAIGCMVCDLGVFYPGLIPYRVMHSVGGIFTHCLPVGFAMYFLYQWVLKEPTVALMPQRVQRRLMPLAKSRPSFSFVSITVVVLCIVAGSASHIFWDSFTHFGRWGVQKIPILGEVAMTVGKGREVRWYAFAQHGSSLLLLPPMLIGFIRWVSRQPASQIVDTRWRLSGKTSLGIIALITLYAVIHFAFVANEYAEDYGIVFVLRSTVQYTGGICFAVLLVYAIITNLIWSAADPDVTAIDQSVASNRTAESTTAE